MTKIEFFNIIMNGLKDFPEIKLQQIISYYENRFSTGTSYGKTESEIISEIGDPNLLVNKYRNHFFKNNTSEAIPNDNFIYNTERTNEIFYSNDNLKDADYINNIANCDSYDTSDTYKSNNKNKAYNSEKYSASSKTSTSKNHINTNIILKIGILILTLTIFSPIITGIIGFIIGIFGLAIGLFLGGIGLLAGGAFTNFLDIPHLPLFISNFPFPAIVLFALGTIILSILLIILFYYFCKWCFRIIINIYNKFKSDGGLI